MRLARRLADYVAHTRDHMRSEEAVFYAHSERVLTDADWAMLLAESTPDDPMGNQALLAKEYPHLAAQLFSARQRRRRARRHRADRWRCA